MKIPALLERKLKGNHALQECVHGTLRDFWPWIERSTTPLFPEYTDHGPDHIEAVLRGAVSLMSDRSQKHVSDGDAATLILATLLHDIAMHLTEDGFIALIDPQSTRPLIDGFRDRPWSALWLDFSGEARRFSQRQLVQLFGEAEPVEPPTPDSNPQRWTRAQRVLIGEFLRRHHPRLAHEVALWGVPGPSSDALRLRCGEPYVADLAGLVARSHGLPLRTSADYLEVKYDLHEFRRIHAVWLMTLLRVADYLQIEDSRAPGEVLRVSRLRSPVSQREWGAHAAVRDIRPARDDPEAIVVHAEPGDVQTFFKIKEWQNGVQAELDASWATLGEVYGRLTREELDELGLSLRRVRSNLDDAGAEYFKRIPFAPRRAAFRTADAELLKLLVAPLYGNRPEIGVRELLQNAVDAVRELAEYQREVRATSDPDLPEQNADVVISLDRDEGGDWWITVSDRGIGMTEDTVCDYYLRAGASLRTSEAWKRQFAAEGTSKILRSGRFGVGALAGFLLGGALEVSTRHVTRARDRGIRFTAELDTELIELRYASRPVGTTIRCKLSPHAIALTERNKWDSWEWYCLGWPRVRRFVEGRELPQRFTLPLPNGALPSDWSRLKHPHYADIQWSYSDAPLLSCNGITVVRGERDHRGQPDTTPATMRWFPRADALKVGLTRAHLRWVRPNLAVHDPDGHLPLNLQRDGLTEDEYPFEKQLSEALWKDLFAALLVRAPNLPPDAAGGLSQYARSVYAGMFPPGRVPEWSGWLATHTGTMISDPWIIGRLSSVVVIAANEEMLLQTLPFDPKAPLLPAFLRGETPEHWLHMIHWRTGKEMSWAGTPFVASRVVGIRLLLPRDFAATFVEYSHRQTMMENVPEFMEEDSGDDWVLLHLGRPSARWLERSTRSRLFTGRRARLANVFILQCYLRPVSREMARLRVLPTRSIASMWKRIVGNRPIPYDVAERRRRLRRIYELIPDFVRRHEEMLRAERAPA